MDFVWHLEIRTSQQLVFTEFSLLKVSQVCILHGQRLHMSIEIVSLRENLRPFIQIVLKDWQKRPFLTLKQWYNSDTKRSKKVKNMQKEVAKTKWPLAVKLFSAALLQFRQCYLICFFAYSAVMFLQCWREVYGVILLGEVVHDKYYFSELRLYGAC